MLHIYTTNLQPATKYIDDTFLDGFEFTNKPNKLIYARCCGKKRPAKNLVVQCYYAALINLAKNNSDFRLEASTANRSLNRFNAGWQAATATKESKT